MSESVAVIRLSGYPLSIRLALKCEILVLNFFSEEFVRGSLTGQAITRGQGAINSSICISRMEYRSMYFPPEVDFLHSWANFQADRLYKSNDTYQYKCGGVKAYKKGSGLASGCCPSLKNA